MNYQEFIESTKLTTPPNHLSLALTALWYDLKGNWDRAHDFADSDYGPECCWVHAYLHRVEGDRFNAGYWYKRARKDFPTQTLEEERTAMIKELLVG